MTGNHVGLELIAKGFGEDHTVKEYGRLSYLGLLQIILCPAEHQIRDAESEHFIGFLKHLAGFGIIVIKILAHPHELCPLTGENISFHYFAIFGLSPCPGIGQSRHMGLPQCPTLRNKGN